MSLKVLILGANGQLARNTTRVFLRDTDAQLTLYLRRAGRLGIPDPSRGRLVVVVLLGVVLFFLGRSMIKQFGKIDVPADHEPGSSAAGVP